MQDLDTCGVLRTFAENPGSNEARLAFILLRRRASVRMSWEYVQHNAKLNVDSLYCAGLGVSEDAARKASGGDLPLEDALKELYSLSPEAYDRALALLISNTNGR